MSGTGGRLLGTPARPLRVAIIGSGPAGFYAVDALTRAGLDLTIDMFDRMPAPYGLVRFGVAPDHQNIKAVTRIFARLAESERFRFFGNIEFGRDLVIDDLRQHYDQVVFAVGAPADRRLEIPGEDLAGCHTATSFVGWYNGHPDYQGLVFDLRHERVAIVGVGNVAMDVTRMLVKDPDQLAATDISGPALDALRGSRVREVFVLGRRGPAQAAFSPKEIQEIGGLDGVDLVVDPAELELDPLSEAGLASDVEARRNIEYLRERSRLGEGTNPRKVQLRFLVSPVELIGQGGNVSAVRIERNTLEADARGQLRARGTGQFEVLPCGLVFRSVGYRGVALPGLPFDARAGIIPNVHGRIIDPATASPIPGLYVAGWIKRGPRGLIGTNKVDSAETVASMLEDLPRPRRAMSAGRTPLAIPALLARRQLRYVSYADWQLLDRLELERGKALGKVREKFSSVAQMLAALEPAQRKI